MTVSKLQWPWLPWYQFRLKVVSSLYLHLFLSVSTWNCLLFIAKLCTAQKKGEANGLWLPGILVLSPLGGTMLRIVLSLLFIGWRSSEIDVKLSSSFYLAVFFSYFQAIWSWKSRMLLRLLMYWPRAKVQRVTFSGFRDMFQLPQ